MDKGWGCHAGDKNKEISDGNMRYGKLNDDRSSQQLSKRVVAARARSIVWEVEE
jgi:hypothetical protein